MWPLSSTVYSDVLTDPKDQKIYSALRWSTARHLRAATRHLTQAAVKISSKYVCILNPSVSPTSYRICVCDIQFSLHMRWVLVAAICGVKTFFPPIFDFMLFHNSYGKFIITSSIEAFQLRNNNSIKCCHLRIDITVLRFHRVMKT